MERDKMWSLKTRRACDCGFLQYAADNPDLPVHYDARLKEYHFVYSVNGGEGRLLIRHCFFCGGKAPESKRDSLFAKLSRQEQDRLAVLTQPLKTVEEVLATFGEPDHDYQAGERVITPEEDGKPERVESYRTLIYQNLSETADVHVTAYPNNRVRFWLTGKYLGDNEGQPEGAVS